MKLMKAIYGVRVKDDGAAEFIPFDNAREAIDYALEQGVRQVLQYELVSAGTIVTPTIKWKDVR